MHEFRIRLYGVNNLAKKTTMNTTGGANVMGSYPYPPNGLIEMDYEFILIFKKPGTRKYLKDAKLKSKLTKEEWKTYFTAHWNLAGERQKFHEAMFPEELPRRLIKMFTFVDDTVMDPFMGSGTTAKVALELNRNVVGYELNEGYSPILEEKAGAVDLLTPHDRVFEIKNRSQLESTFQKKGDKEYFPEIQDLKPTVSNKKLNLKSDNLYRAVEILHGNIVKLNSGLKVTLLGTKNISDQYINAKNYLERYVKGKQVSLEFDPLFETKDDSVQGYLFLKNKIFVNREIVRLGFAEIPNYDFKYKGRFERVMPEIKNAQRMDSE